MSSVYKSILSAGKGLNLGHVGTRVINTLRMEKGFRGWVLILDIVLQYLFWVTMFISWTLKVGVVDQI